MANGAGKPSGILPRACLAVVAGLVGFSFYRWNASKKADRIGAIGRIPQDRMGSIKQQARRQRRLGAGREPRSQQHHHGQRIQLEPSKRLPEVPGTADLTPALGKPRIVKFAVNVWRRLGADHLGQPGPPAEEAVEGRQGQTTSRSSRARR